GGFQFLKERQMVNGESRSRGTELEKRLHEGRRQAETAPLPGSRDLPVLSFITPKGECECPLENAIVVTRDILITSNRVFTYGNSMVLEVDCSDGGGLR